MTDENVVTKEEKQVEEMLPSGKELILSDGSKIYVKPISWGKEIQVCKLISNFMTASDMLKAINAVSSLKEDDSTESVEALTNILLPLMENAPTAITQIVGLVLDKPNEYIEESLTSEDVMQVFIPFLKETFNKYMRMFKIAK
jgi:hypothetical protein